MYSGDRAPHASRRSATLPATNGHAIDVPDSTAYPHISTGNVEATMLPGAATCGLLPTSGVGSQLVYELANPPVCVLGSSIRANPASSGGVKWSDTWAPERNTRSHSFACATDTMPADWILEKETSTALMPGSVLY